MLNFRNPYGTCTGSCLAATYTGYYTGSTIYDADIVTNSTGYAWASAGEACSSEMYVEGVMVHKVGHLLGLGHTNVAGATMYPPVSYCNNGPATTEADDQAGGRHQLPVLIRSISFSLVLRSEGGSPRAPFLFSSEMLPNQA